MVCQVAFEVAIIIDATTKCAHILPIETAGPVEVDFKLIAIYANWCGTVIQIRFILAVLFFNGQMDVRRRVSA